MPKNTYQHSFNGFLLSLSCKIALSAYFCRSSIMYMICFPNAKINLGLHVLEKRPDNFHNIETLFYPIGFNDMLECIPTKAAKETGLHLSGIPIEGNSTDNLVMKAFRLLQTEYELPAFDIYLHKSIPAGSGLGGGSSDAAFMLKLLNESQHLGIPQTKLEEYAGLLGADCAFFIQNKPLLAFDKGNRFQAVNFSLKGLFLVLLIPKNIQVSTKEAYAGILAQKPAHKLEDCIRQQPENWKDCLVNDFEASVFAIHPELAKIKQALYDAGALYASMSGSGSSIFALFNSNCQLNTLFPDCYYWSTFL